ncbi:MAG: Crp/Fnr family transcriptional regulator [Candidatus Woesearchaeota archaeon]
MTKEGIHLKMIELFSALTDDELETISKLLSVKKFKKNEIILYEEDTSKYMYIILSGKVKVVQITNEGKEILLAIHHAGEFFGEMSFIDGKTSPATIIAAEDCIINIISKEEFYSTIINHKQILYNLLLILCSRLRESWEKIQLLNLKNASERLKIFFYMLSNKYGERTNRGITLNIKLTHQEIAEMTGMARETVTRVLDKWNKEGDISVVENKFIQLKQNFFDKDLKLTI